MKKKYQAHPWHGIFIGEQAPEMVMSFIEMTPSDSVIRKFRITATQH